MIEYIRLHQLDIMLVLSSICVLLAFFAGITKSLSSRKRVGLLLTETSAAILLWADRLAYIYRGNTTELGWYMVRFTNFTVFLFTLFIIFAFNIYLEELFVANGKTKKVPRRLRAVAVLVAVGIILLIISQFTGWYYTFDETNHYVRGPLFIISYAVPLASLFILLSAILDLFYQLSRGIRFSLMLFTIIPIVASIAQIFTYGISLTNISIVGTAVLLYIFALIDINNTAERANQLEIEYLKKSQKRAQLLFEQTATALVNAIDAKDKYTHGHSSRVGEYSRKIAEYAGKSEQECQEIYYAALLHDVGKIGIPKDIINKEGKLTNEEYEVIKQHPVLGKQILSSISEYPYLSIGANHHHERYDGKGYPDKLKGEDIPEIARIVAVADAYDAMTSKRSYRDPIPQQKVREEFVKGAGTQFDPEFAKIMVHLIDLDEEYEMKEKGDVKELAGKNDLVCQKYRTTVSEGIVVTPFKTKVHLKTVARPASFSDARVCIPSLILFDSLDGRIHLDEKLKKDLNYFEYAQFRFDGAYVNSGVRAVKVEKSKVNAPFAVEDSSASAAVEYDIEFVKFHDHMQLKVANKKQVITFTVAFPDSSRYAYLSLTGEYCYISNVEISKEEKRIDASYIPRIAEEISYINVPAGDIPNIQVDGYRTASSEGIPITDGMQITFHSKSLPTARLVWHCPFIVIFYSDNKKIEGPGYREFALIRFDGENWESDDEVENKLIVNRSDKFEGWEGWKECNRQGIDCTVTFQRKGNKVTAFTENAGISIKNITTLDETVKDVYVSLTGDQCAITNIKIQ